MLIENADADADDDDTDRCKQIASIEMGFHLAHIAYCHALLLVACSLFWLPVSWKTSTSLNFRPYNRLMRLVVAAKQPQRTFELSCFYSFYCFVHTYQWAQDTALFSHVGGWMDGWMDVYEAKNGRGEWELTFLLHFRCTKRFFSCLLARNGQKSVFSFLFWWLQTHWRRWWRAVIKIRDLPDLLPIFLKRMGKAASIGADIPELMIGTSGSEE